MIHQPQTLGELKRSPHGVPERARRSVKDEMRQNLLARLCLDAPLFPGVLGYDDSVIPQIVNALLSRHNFILLGLRGQAKSRILRSLGESVTPNVDEIATVAGYALGRAARWVTDRVKDGWKSVSPTMTIAILALLLGASGCARAGRSATVAAAPTTRVVVPAPAEVRPRAIDARCDDCAPVPMRPELARAIEERIAALKARGGSCSSYGEVLERSYAKGQITLRLLSDPLGTGADWLGTGGLTPNQALIAPTVVAVVQAGAIVTGHVLGLVVAHEQALHLVDRRHAVVGQVPLMVLMVLYTVGGCRIGDKLQESGD